MPKAKTVNQMTMFEEINLRPAERLRSSKTPTPMIDPNPVQIQKRPVPKKQQIAERKETPHPLRGPAIKSIKNDVPMEVIYQQILSGLKEFFDKTKFKRGVLGLSGGLDSALVLKLTADALGSENVTALIMPELGLTAQENIDHAKALCTYLKTPYHYQPINTFLMDFKMLPWKPNNLANMNVKARIRMCLLYTYANTENALVLGTSNKSELLLGYATKYGDMACDVEVIGDLLKTEAIALADYLGLPPEIVHKTPTAELTAGQTDEVELGAPYQEIDKVLAKIHLGLNGCIEHGMPANLVHRVFRLIEANKHKTELPYIIPAHR